MLANIGTFSAHFSLWFILLLNLSILVLLEILYSPPGLPSRIKNSAQNAQTNTQSKADFFPPAVCHLLQGVVKSVWGFAYGKSELGNARRFRIKFTNH